jgi:hypothetical protein
LFEAINQSVQENEFSKLAVQSLSGESRALKDSKLKKREVKEAFKVRFC